MIFGKSGKKNTEKKSKKKVKSEREKRLLRRALIEDPSIKREAKSASDAEDIYDEDDFSD